MAEEKKGFIDFILEAQQDLELAKEFCETDNQEKLTKFFDEKGFNDINIREVKKIMKAKEEKGFTKWPPEPPPAY